jgi:Fe2+ transport system protein FeoA
MKLRLIIFVMANSSEVGAKFLHELKRGEQARVRRLGGDPALVQRLSEMGILPGVPIRFLQRAPLGDPLAFDVEGRRFSLRRVDAARIEVS